MTQAETTQEAERLTEEARFTRRGFARGGAASLPLCVSVLSIGLVFGVLSGQAGMTPLEATLMSLAVYAGAAQFVSLDLWPAQGFPEAWSADWATALAVILPLVLTTLVINLRHILMGMTLSPWFRRLPPLKAYPTLFVCIDESWALTMTEVGKGGRDMAFLLGSGLALYVAWVGGTLVGALAGGAVADPAALGLDFAFTAAFLVILTGMWRGTRDVPCWLVAGAAAIVADRMLPGAWYILAGGLAGSLAGLFGRQDSQHGD